MDVEVTPAAEVDRILSAVADPLLATAGFVPGARRRWVRSFPPIRHVFELTAMKGASLLTRWGFSLDFVPHLQGRRLAWHRTEAKAHLDLVYDPIDFDREWEVDRSIGTLRGPTWVQRDAERVLPKALAAAVSWLRDARDDRAVLERAEWLRTADRPGMRFRFDNFVQQPLAYAFLLARTGDVAAGRRVLDHWITSQECEPLREKLVALLVS
jgi:hypothetical protein